ncbi:hypothetical protein Fmac_001881 [Flemingia macrophylla]|uniref:Pentatricopeptide repeat-containing protein n=1 Tax=Flemingia macrophylla TaxID=520843 RepID=A0ABD1NIX5_9FABA
MRLIRVGSKRRVQVQPFSPSRCLEALSLFEEKQGIVCDLITYNSLIKGLCKKGELVKATELLNELLAQGLEPSVFSFNPLIKGLCEVGDTQGAIRLWKDMHDRHLEPTASTHDYIITGLCKEGNMVQGIEWLLNMLSWKLKPHEQTFEYLITCMSQEDSGGSTNGFKPTRSLTPNLPSTSALCTSPSRPPHRFSTTAALASPIRRCGPPLRQLPGPLVVVLAGIRGGNVIPDVGLQDPAAGPHCQEHGGAGDGGELPESRLNSVVLVNNLETVSLPLNEPVYRRKMKSQIKTYLKFSGL